MNPVPTVSPLQAAIGILIVDIGNAAVAFGAFNNTIAAVVETAVVGAVSLGFLIANALHHNANAKVAAARATSGGR